MTTSTDTYPARARGNIAYVLRLEGLALFALSLALYARSGAGWSQFAWLFLVPDISLAGYLLGPARGAAIYNAVHSELGPMLLGAASLLGLLPVAALPLALIWAAHVGFDRALGYGLKYASGFTQTHLGEVGQAKRERAAELQRAKI
jgi:hypothetical protein